MANEYRGVPFPFHIIETPDFKIEKELGLHDFTGHLRTWSAVQRYIDKNNSNPIDILIPDLSLIWNSEEIKKVTWNLILKVGRK